jgi:uncharacterized protein (TIGR02145 family)
MSSLIFKKISLLAILALANISCSNDITEGDKGDKVPMNLAAEIINYTTTRFSGGNAFEDGDKIGLYVTEATNDLDGYRTHDNELLTYSKGKLLSNETLFFSSENSNSKFLAYYPYTSVSSQPGSTLIPLSVQANQRSSSDFYASDFMVASKTSEATEQTITLPFKHKLCLVDITISCSKDVYETIMESSSITLHDVYTSAYYDTKEDAIDHLSDKKDITLHGTWTVSQDKDNDDASGENLYKLEGMNFIAIPQDLEGNDYSIVIGDNTIGGQFSIGEKMESGIHYRVNVKYNSSTSEFEFGSCTIESWPDAKDSSTITAEEFPYILDLSSIDFSESLVYRLYNSSDKLIGQICKEYLYQDGVIDASAIVYYPNCNLKAGKVLQIVGSDESTCGGSVCWNNDGTLSYTAGTEVKTTLLIVKKDGSITTTTNENNCKSVTVKPYTLDDDRDGESNVVKYPIVKIGAQYWMATQLRATRYNDGESMSCNDSDYSTQRAGYYTKDKECFYNTAAVRTLKLAPKGWHLPRPTELAAMKNYLGTGAGNKLKAQNGWDSYDEVPQGTNVTGFNAKAIGCYFYNSNTKSVGYVYGGQFLFIWAMNDAGTDINDSGILLSYQSKEILTGKQTYENIGCSVRCLRND